MKYVKNLEEKTKEALLEIMKTHSNHKVRIRAHAIILSAKQYKIDQLAAIFEVDRDTISDWLRKWEKNGIEGLFDSLRTGRPPKD